MLRKAAFELTLVFACYLLFDFTDVYTYKLR